MPGMAASAAIFEHIKFSDERFEMHFLDWEIPNKNESLQLYAKKMAAKIIHQEAVLIGVSFGGVLVQEMSAFLSLKKLIIISSIKSRREMPRRLLFVSFFKLYKLLPYRIISDIDRVTKYVFGVSAKHRVALYKKYLAVNSPLYLRWAMEHMVNWNPANTNGVPVHIHGKNDKVFPFKHLEGHVHEVQNGTHVMVVTCYKWLNKHLPKLILESEQPD
jgi:pimeloyl-ACP methyl ester carboxylesterase